MGNQLSKIWNSPSVRNVGKLLSANVIAQALGILVYPILTRMYSPEDFGLLNLFMSIGGILVLLSTANYHYAIVLPKENKQARSLVQLCLCFLVPLVLVIALTIPFSNSIASLFHTPELAKWWWLMPLYIGGMGAWSIVNNYYIRTKSFYRISTYQLSQSVYNVAGKLGLGYAGCLSGGMIVSTAFAPILAIFTSLWQIGRNSFIRVLDVDRDELRNVAYEYRKFPLYSLPQVFVNALSSNLSIILLTPAFGTSSVGYFGMALTLAYRPLQMVVQSVYQVLYQRMADLVNHNRSIRGLAMRYVRLTCMILIPLFAVLYIILPQMTTFLLGDGWGVSGEYIRLMLPWLLMMCLTSSMTFLPDIFGLQRPALYVEIIYTLLRCISLIIGIGFDDIKLAIFLYSIFSAMVIAGQLIWYLIIIQRYEQSLNNGY